MTRCLAPVPEPTLAGFLDFVRTYMGITTTILPDASPVIDMSFCVALELVYEAIQCASPRLYNLAVYNLAGSTLIAYAQDLPEAAIVPGSDPPLPFFAYYRALWNVNGFVTGVVQASADESTSQSLVVMEAAKNFTLANLAQLKDPYGRAYLAIAQDAGDIWGLS